MNAVQYLKGDLVKVRTDKGVERLYEDRWLSTYVGLKGLNEGHKYVWVPLNKQAEWARTVTTNPGLSDL